MSLPNIVIPDVFTWHMTPPTLTGGCMLCYVEFFGFFSLVLFYFSFLFIYFFVCFYRINGEICSVAHIQKYLIPGRFILISDTYLEFMLAVI